MPCIFFTWAQNYGHFSYFSDVFLCLSWTYVTLWSSMTIRPFEEGARSYHTNNVWKPNRTPRPPPRQIRTKVGNSSIAYNAQDEMAADIVGSLVFFIQPWSYSGSQPPQCFSWNLPAQIWTFSSSSSPAPTSHFHGVYRLLQSYSIWVNMYIHLYIHAYIHTYVRT